MLRVLSFHSVKGGVGKSTLATLAAHGAARRHPEMRVVLIDMDLTGTSLADVLPICAPRWADGLPDLLKAPVDFWSRSESMDRLEERDDGGAVRKTVPVLNDFLTFASPDWDAAHDIPAQALLWAVEGPENLFVIPSSALPIDLEYTLPLIFDEEHSAYLESRLEYLLADLAQVPTWVIFDVPPTIPGLSRAVISLALRLGGEPRAPLAKGGTLPGLLATTPIAWRAGLIATLDRQDHRALQRWIDQMQPEERPRFKVILNRVGGHVAPGQLDLIWRQGAVDASPLDLGPRDDLLDDPLRIPEDAALQFFAHGADGTPPVHACIDALLDLVDA